MQDFNNQIFNSLVSPSTPGPTSAPTAALSTAEKRKTIFSNINKLDRAMKLDIMAIVVSKGMGALIRSCSEGVVIDLNNLDPDTINQMYYMLDYKINNI